MNETSYWIHDLSPFLWEFPENFKDWGPGGIRWYGISYLLGFISAFFLLKKYFENKKSPYDSEQIMNLMTFTDLANISRLALVLKYVQE